MLQLHSNCDRKKQVRRHHFAYIVLLLFVFLFLQIFSNPAFASGLSRDTVLMGVREIWLHMPDEAEIADAYERFQSSAGSNVSIIAGPLKKHIPEETDPLVANRVFLKLIVTLDAKENITIPQAMSLKYDFDNSRFYFTGVFFPGILRDGDSEQATGCLLYNEDLDWLNDGWITETGDEPPMSSARPTSPQSTTADDMDDWDDSDDADDWDSGDDEIPWEVVVGPAAVGVAVVAILNKAAKKKKAAQQKSITPKANSKKKSNSSPATPKSSNVPQPTTTKPSTKKHSSEPEKEPEQPTGYLLQLSQDKLSMTVSQPIMLEIMVLSVDAAGKTAVEPMSTIELILQPNTALAVTPTVGKGRLQVQVIQTTSANEPTEEIIIAATAPGVVMNGTVLVNTEMQLRMVFF